MGFFDKYNKQREQGTYQAPAQNATWRDAEAAIRRDNPVLYEEVQRQRTIDMWNNYVDTQQRKYQERLNEYSNGRGNRSYARESYLDNQRRDYMEYTRGRGNRSYLREGMADGSYQAGMQAVNDRQRQQEWQKVSTDYERVLSDYNKAQETTRRASAVTGPMSPEQRTRIEQARQAEAAAKQRLDETQARLDALTKGETVYSDMTAKSKFDSTVDRILGIDSSKVTGQKTDWGKLIKGAAYKGADQFSTSMVGGLNWLFGGAAEEIHNLGVETINGIIGGVNSLTGANIKQVENNGNLLTNWYETLKETKAHNEEAFAANANSSRAAQIVDEFGTSFVAAVPMALEALMTAPYAAAKAGATATTAGLQYLSGLQAAKGLDAVGMMAQQSMSKMMQNPQFWTSYVQAIGDSSESAAESGMSPRDAAIYTMINGFFNAVIEVGGGDDTLGGIQTFPMRLQQLEEQGGKKAVVEWFKDSVLGEGLEEVAQGVFERGVKAPATGAAIASLDPNDTEAIFNPWTSAQEFTGGAVVGGLLGGGQVAAQNSMQTIRGNKSFKGDSQVLLDSAKKSGGETYAKAIEQIEQNAQRDKNGAVQLNQDQAAQLYDIIRNQGETGEYIGAVQDKRNGELLTTVFSNDGIDLTEAEHESLTGLVNEGSAGVTDRILGMRDAYKAGESGQKLADVMLEMEGRGLTFNQIAQAWKAGANVQTDVTGPVDVNTEEGRATLEANLAPLGTHIDAAVNAYDGKQDAARYSAAMQKAAFLYAANGADLTKIVQDARDGKVADIVGYLTDEQVKIAQDIGNEQRAQIREAEQTAAARTQELQEQAAAITKGQTVTAQALAEMDTAIDVANRASQRAVDTINQTVASLEAMAKANPKAAQTEAYKKAYDAAMQQKKKIEGLQKTVTELRRRKAELEGRKTIQRKKGTVSYSGGTVDGVKYDGVDQTKLTRQQQKVVAMVERLADAVNLDYVFISADPGMGGAYVKGGTVYVNINAGMGVGSFSQTMAAASLSHELTHWMQDYAPEQYRELKDFIVAEILKADPQELNRLVQQQQRWEKARSLSYEQALDEVVANACQTMLLDSKAINKLARQNMNLAERIRDFIEDWSSKIKEAFAEVDTSQGSIYDSLRAVEGSLDRIQELWDEGIEAAAQSYNAEQTVREANVAQKATNENAAQKGGVQKQAWKPIEFGEEVQQWYDSSTSEERRKDTGFFRVGTTSEPLKSIGVKDGILIWGKGKMEKILLDHAGEGIDLDVIKQVPDITERPVFVLKSKTVPGSIVLFGTVETKTGRKMLATVSLTPGMGKNLNVDLSVITGAYSRRNNQMRNMLTSSEILYIDGSEENERTNEWLKQIGLQLPSRTTNVGSIGSITYTADGVKISGKTWEELFGEDAAQMQSWDNMSAEEQEQTIQENKAFNKGQTKTGSPLRTLKGSDISRGGTINKIRYPVGKVISSRLYIHKDYIGTAIKANPEFGNVLRNAENALRGKYPDFEYNCISYHPASGEILFQEAPGFDTEREPMVGMQVKVTADGTVSDMKPVTQIWHHKWQWVDNDYDGFDVRESWEWSKQWLSTIVGASKGGSLNAWNGQLKENGLPTNEPIRFQLLPVEPVQPSSDAWQRSLTEPEALKIYPDMWDTSKAKQTETEEEKRKRDSTQRANTLSTYGKIYDILKREGFTGKILDASSGLGLGTQLGRTEYGFDVTDIEPYPDPTYKPMFTDYSTHFGQYDAIISSAVLNVVAQDQRDALVVKMGQLLKTGGKMYVTARTTNGDVDNLAKSGKNVQLGPHEFIETVHNHYQKGFTNPELKAYLQDALGDEFVAEIATGKNKFNNNTAVIVTKVGKGDRVQAQFQTWDNEYGAAVKSGDMETAQRMVDEAAEAAGYTIKAFHGTRSFGFTVFDPSKADDGISLFATSDRRTAETYSGVTDRNRIKDRVTKNADDLHGEELIEEARKYNKRYQEYSLMSDKDKDTVRESAKSSIDWSIRRAMEFVRDHNGAFDSDKSYIMDRLISSLYHLRDSETGTDISDAWNEWEDALWDLKGIDDSIAIEFLDDVDSRGLFQSKNELDDMTYQGDMYADWYMGGPDYLFDNQLQIELNAEYHKGIYELRCKPGKQLVIDSTGENWNQITPPKELQDYGLYGPQMTRAIASAAKALGYDSVLLRGLRDNGGETAYNGISDVYIFFDSNALKSADPVTYDDSGNVIPLSERFQEGNNDIRFQSWDDTDGDNAAERNGREQSYARLQSENKILSNTIKGLNKLIAKKDTTIGQLQDRLKLNKTPEVREADAKKLARQLLREHNSSTDADSLAAEIKALGDYLVQAKEVSEDEVKSRARNIAAEILQNATEQYQMEDEQLDAIRGAIKGKKLTISPDFLGELDQAGGYDLFRRQNFGKFTLARADSKSINRDDYMSVSQFYADMHNQYGETYFPDAANEGEEAIILASVMQAAAPMEVNPYRQYMGEATEELANRITRDALDGILRLEPDRYADVEYLKEKTRNEALNARVKQLVEENALTKEEAGKLWQQVHDLNTQLEHADLQYRALMNAAEDRIAQVRAEGIVREVETRAKERERAAKNIQALKDHYKELQQNARERREESAGVSKYRKQVFEKAGKLREMLLKNDDKLHVPEVLKAPLAAFLESLDFTSMRALRGGAETNADRAFAANLQKIQQILSNQQDYINGGDMKENLGGYIDVSPDSMDFLRRVSEMITTALSENREYTINQMSAAELKDLSNFLSNLRTAINGMNKFMANARFESVREAASADIQTIQELGRVGTTENGKLFHAAAWENGTPYYIFRRFGEGGKAIFDSFTRGWEKMAFNVKEIMDFTEKAYTDKEVRDWQKETHAITLEDGSEITMTTAQIMELSMLLNREQAVKHLSKGGMRIADIEGKKGITTDTRHHHLTDADIKGIVGLLTPRQAQVAKALQTFMAVKGAEWGNEISMRRFGYRFYTEGENYYPIKTDSNDRPMSDTDAQQNSMFRLLNLSASKSLNPKASNALIVGDIFDTFANHTSDMAKLNGMGLPILDAIKWFNFKERIDLDDGGYNTRTMQGAMEEAFGKQALSYFRTLMKDINGVTESGDRGTGFWSKLLSNYKAAAVGANLRVAFLQPTSYVRASYLIKPKYLLQAFTNKNAYKEAMENSGTAVWKSLGYYDTNIARGMRDQIKHNEGWRDKVVEKSMALAEFGDKRTWGRLWVACKMQAAAETGKSGDELIQATADLFREVIYSSQVMDSTLTRSELMRGKSQYTKALTAFMAEPTLSYNMVMDAGMEIMMNARRYGKGEAWKRSRGYFTKAISVYVCSAAFSAVVESIADAFRDDDDEEDFFLKWSQAMFGEGNLLSGNLAQDLSLFGKLPYIKNLMSALQGYKNKDMSTAALDSILDAYKIWKETIDLATGELDKPTKVTYYGKMTTWGKIYKTLQGISQLSGIAVANMTRDVTALWNTTVGAMYPEYKVKTYDGNMLSASKSAAWEEHVKNTGIKKTEYGRILKAADTGGNGSVSQDEMGAYLLEALDKGEITEDQAQALWRSQWNKPNSTTFDKWREKN